MKRAIAAVARSVLLVAALCCVSCFTPDPDWLGVLSTRDFGGRVTVLRTGVWGRHCPLGWGIGDFGEAVDHALRAVPGANALVDASMYYQEVWFAEEVKICADVRGDAVRVE